MVRALFLAIVALAGPSSLWAAATADFSKDCPPFGAAICRGQPCGAHSEHNWAYNLRVGHIDYDWVSGLFYNQGTKKYSDWKNWHYFAVPDPEDIDGWCLSPCSVVKQRKDPEARKDRCKPDDKEVGPPASRPPFPAIVKCFMGDDISGGIDFSKYTKCGGNGAVSTSDFFTNGFPEIKRTSRRTKVSEGGGGDDAECTGGNPACVCVKGDAAFGRYEHAANRAIEAGFPGQSEKPKGMSDSAATKKMCDAFNGNARVAQGWECRSQGDEIVLEDGHAVEESKPAVSVDVITSEGKFWRKAIAACASGIH